MQIDKNENNRIKWYRNPSITGLTGMLAAVLILGVGCAAGGRPPVPPVGKVPLPSYHEGTTYVYDNGSWETVQTVGPEKVTWRNNRGNDSSGSPDFTYRRVTWETRTRSGTRRFHELRDWAGNPSAATLWPLAPGKMARYTELGRWKDVDNREHTYEAQWRLEVGGQERISVKAGEFDTWKIIGRRFSPGGAFTSSRLREKRIWYYAPALEHYVKEERHYLGRRPDRSIELLAVIPAIDGMNANARATLNANFQKALEKQPSGAALGWNRAELGLSGTTTPKATFKLASGEYCRQYVQRLDWSGDEQTFFGLACRTGIGRWEIPRR